MSTQWQYQVRINLDEQRAALARHELDNSAIKWLADILEKHGTTIKCQYDAFADYCAEAERNGTDDYPLYEWTKATIEDPVKKAKYTTSFTLYHNGDEVYDKSDADALETDLQPLVDDGLILKLSKYDTNPANSPQPPKRYRK